jgi:hypothetical protein
MQLKIYVSQQARLKINSGPFREDFDATAVANNDRLGQYIAFTTICFV